MECETNFTINHHFSSLNAHVSTCLRIFADEITMNWWFPGCHGGTPSHHPFRTMGFSPRNHPAIGGTPIFRKPPTGAADHSVSYSWESRAEGSQSADRSSDSSCSCDCGCSLKAQKDSVRTTREAIGITCSHIYIYTHMSMYRIYHINIFIYIYILYIYN